MKWHSLCVTREVRIRLHLGRATFLLHTLDSNYLQFCRLVMFCQKSSLLSTLYLTRPCLGWPHCAHVCFSRGPSQCDETSFGSRRWHWGQKWGELKCFNAIKRASDVRKGYFSQYKCSAVSIRLFYRMAVVVIQLPHIFFNSSTMVLCNKRG
jgi:hypothetical protein